MVKEIINSFNSTPHTSLASFLCPRGVLQSECASCHCLNDRQAVHKEDSSETWFSPPPCRPHLWPCGQTIQLIIIKNDVENTGSIWQCRTGLSHLAGIIICHHSWSHLDGISTSARFVFITERHARWSWKTYTQQVKILTLISGSSVIVLKHY